MEKIIKTVVAVLVYYAFIVGVLTIAADRIEAIENGDLIQVSESYMDR